MAGYSRDIERQNRALQSILDGGTPEKRIFVTKEDLEFKNKLKREKEEEKKRIDEKFEATKGARMPWFCPKCDKLMKKRLDNKTWFLYDHCFDCQIKFENKLRIEGKYEEWEEKKVLNNQLSYIKDQINSIDDWKDETSKPLEVFDQVGVQDVELHTEKWSQNKEKVEEMSNEALEELNKMKEDVEEKLNSFEI